MFRALLGAAASVISLDEGWLFGGPYTTGSSAPRFDDRTFAVVTLPHCVTPLSWREWDPGAWEKLWIYRRHFNLPAGASGLRTFVDFDGALTSATPTINGVRLPEHLGGYLPFTYELTNHVQQQGNVLAVKLDSTWQDVPPEGKPGGAASIDYLEPGGLYRDVWLRMVPQVFIADMFAKPVNVLDTARQVDIHCTIDAAVIPSAPVRVDAVLLERGRAIVSTSAPVKLDRPGQVAASLTLGDLGNISLWDVDNPNLYEVVVTVYVNNQPVHDFTRRIGFREAVFDVDGFFLNGSRLKLFGLNRHQIFPYRGMAMPARVQQRDAAILKQQLNCNVVRCSHYPQSSYFLDACDGLGIMVWEETPGWGYLGDTAWQQIMLQNVHDMVVRDRSRPSVVIWGVRPDEAPTDPPLFTEAKNLANSLDGTRPTSGAMSQYSTKDWVQEVFAYDDYSNSRGNAELRPPLSGVPYLVTEAVGALGGPPYFRRIDTQAVQADQARLHAQVHNIAASDDGYCGLLGWCGFDYDSLKATVYEGIKWPGVVDTFRVPKPGAASYQAQVDPAVRPVIAPAFYWDFGTFSPVTSLGSQATVWSNCDRLEAYLDGAHCATLLPDSQNYPYLLAKPFYLDVTHVDGSALPDLRLDGYVGSRLAATRSFAANPAGDHLAVTADDSELDADGSDATRVSFRAVDKFGAPRPYAEGTVSVRVDGPGTYVGEVVALTMTASAELIEAGQQTTVTARLANGSFTFADNGGVGAVWVRSLPGAAGSIRVTAAHPTLGSGSVLIRSVPPQPPAPPGTTPPPAGSPSGREASGSLSGVTLALQLPDGWTAQARSATTFGSVPVGASVQASWQVTAPSAVSQGASTTLLGQTSFTVTGRPASVQSPVPVYLATEIQDAYNNTGISDDSDTAAADFDGKGDSYSAQALAAAGLTPGGHVSHDGITFIWPEVAAGQPDNVLAGGQTVLVSGSGSTLGVLGASSIGNGIMLGKVFYTDGSSAPFALSLDYFRALPGPENDIIATAGYLNRPSGRFSRAAYVFCAGVPIDAGKSVRAVALLSGGFTGATGKIRGAHIFAIGVG